MKKIGVILIIISLVIGAITNDLPEEFPIEPFVGIAFGYFLLGMAVIILDKNCPKGRTPKMRNPPAPPKKCICNDIGKHSPGGRCEADHSELKCYKSCGNTLPYPKGNVMICLNCGAVLPNK